MILLFYKEIGQISIQCKKLKEKTNKQSRIKKIIKIKISKMLWKTEKL